MTKFELKQLVKEVISEQPAAPSIEPPTKPTTVPSKPTTRPNPLRPTRPGIAPRPKALSHDVKAFLKYRRGVNEKIDTGDMPDLIDPSKRSSIEDEKDYVEEILPNLGPEADRYLEIITSESYQKNLERVAFYLGLKVDKIQEKFPNYPTMAMMAIKALVDIKKIETQFKSKLESMVIDVVLNLEEYKFIKRLVDAGDIIIDAKLGNADLTKSITADKMNQMLSNGLTVAESLNIQLNAILGGNTESKLRRTLANYMTQGDAVNKLFLFNTVSDKLDMLSPKLSNKYGVLSAITQIGYYMTPNFPITSNIVNMSAVGSEQVIPTGDKYTIKVRALTFPYLIHELVKGIGDYISLDVATQDDLDTETLGDEIKQIMAGPALELKLRKLIPTDKIEYLPVVKKLFYRLPIETIKDVLLGGMKAQNIIKGLVKQAEESMQDVD
jgi:hypothetical protein